MANLNVLTKNIRTDPVFLYFSDYFLLNDPIRKIETVVLSEATSVIFLSQENKGRLVEIFITQLNYKESDTHSNPFKWLSNA